MENKIEFHTTDSTLHNTWVMRITTDRKIEVNEDVDVTLAAKKVLDAMQGLLTPKRTWQGLTNKDIEILSDKAENDTWKAIELAEAKLKEKNQ